MDEKNSELNKLKLNAIIIIIKNNYIWITYYFSFFILYLIFIALFFSLSFKMANNRVFMHLYLRTKI